MTGAVALHAGRSALPVGHETVLVASVLGLWLLVVGATLAVDRAFDRLGL